MLTDWDALGLTPSQLAALGEHLEERLRTCDRTRRHTAEWLHVHLPHTDVERVLAGLDDRGGFCDCQVLQNVVLG